MDAFGVSKDTKFSKRLLNKEVAPTCKLLEEVYNNKLLHHKEEAVDFSVVVECLAEVNKLYSNNQPKPKAIP